MKYKLLRVIILGYLKDVLRDRSQKIYIYSNGFDLYNELWKKTSIEYVVVYNEELDVVL